MGRGDRACEEIAEKQFGLISRDQAIGTGMSERAIGGRLGAGRWRQVLPGVYRLAGAPASWEQSLKAATLWGGEGCVVSHRAAAALHGLASEDGRRQRLSWREITLRVFLCPDFN